MLQQFSNGNILLNFIPCEEPRVPDGDDTPLTWAMVNIKKGDHFLLQHNYNRKQWENAGGGIEIGETVKDCAIREALEETCQHITDVKFRGIFKLYLKYHDRCEYGALYEATYDELLPFTVNNESDRLTLWHPDDTLDDRLSELTHWMIIESYKRF
jgi:8-oxo-dGTP diphosphatase